MGTEIRERFRERKYSYKNKKKMQKKLEITEEEQKEKAKENNIKKIIIFSPLLLFGIFGRTIDKILDREERTKLNDEENNEFTDIKDNNIEIKNKTLNNPIPYLYVFRKRNSQSNKEYEEDLKFSEKSIPNDSLEVKIFLKLEKELVRLKNECEIIESEEYLLNKYEKDYDIYLKAQEINKKIEKLLEDLNQINKKFNLLKNNNPIENPLLFDDSLLIDDIISYRNKITKEKEKTIPIKIKLLNEYKYLYENLDKLIEKTEEIKEISNNRVQELSSRDKNFKNAKNKIVNLSEIETCCNLMIEKNNKYLEELSTKVTKIDEKKYIETKLKGMNGFLSTSLRYITLLTLTPLRGLLPGIGARTVATRRLLKNMLENMHYEKTEKIVYSLNNYENEIINKINDIDSVGQNIDFALEDVAKLKEEFRNYYFKYNLEEYRKAYKKIEIIEKNILNDKEKIDIIKQKLIKNKELNRTTLVKVRRLNSE